MKRCVSRSLAAVLAMQAAACCDDTLRGVELNASYPAGDFSNVWLRDTLQTFAVAERWGSLVCSYRLYDSAMRPGAFTYESRDTTIATIDARGLFIAKGLGSTTVLASTGGKASFPVPAQVMPPVARIVQSMTPAAPKVGDTITFSIRAIGRDSAVVPQARLSTQVVPSGYRDTSNLLTLSGNPTTARIQARVSGTFTIISSLNHLTYNGLRVLTDTVRFTILPR